MTEQTQNPAPSGAARKIPVAASPTAAPKAEYETASSQVDADFSKTKLYGLLDIGAKLVTAIALVFFGYLGWTLQASTEASKRKQEQFEIQERKYLPMLQSLSVFELNLDEAEHQIRTRLESAPIEKQPDSLFYFRKGTDLRLAAASIFMPDGDTLVWVRNPTHLRREQVQIPLRSAGLMLAEILRFQYFVAPLKRFKAVRLGPSANMILVTTGDSTDLRIWISPDSIPAFRAVLGDKELTNDPFSVFAALNLIEDLRFAIRETIHKTLSEHVDLGDRYIQIIENIEKNRIVL